MLLRELFESPEVDAAFCFGRFNPAHKGHIEVWKAVQRAGKSWYVGTNPKTVGPNDPLDFNTKGAWMEAIYPELEGHILPEQSVVTLASRLFQLLEKNENATIAYVTDSQDWQWAGKLLNDYNGKEGPHGYYKFRKIMHIESPRVSSATALRTAARAGDEAAFYAASGTDPKLTVNGKTYYDTVTGALQAHPEKVKKVSKKKEAEPAEDVEENFADIDLAIDIKKAISNLPDSKLKDVIEMRFKYDMTFREIGTELGVSGNRAKQIVSKALRHLRYPKYGIVDIEGLDRVINRLNNDSTEKYEENFADGRNPQDKGDSKRHGVPTKASVSTLRKVAKQGGRKGQLAHWMANMKAGRAKKEDRDVRESLRPGEYHVATVTLDNGDVKKFKVTWDEGYREMIQRYYAKQGHKVVDIKMDWSIHVNY